MSQKTLSQYGRIFDDGCKNWTKDKEHNLMFVKMIERHCNELLAGRHYLFLRDVYEMLGITVTKESCIVGWIFEYNNKFGDNFVEFDIREEENSPNITIDFNVDGNIIERFI